MQARYPLYMLISSWQLVFVNALASCFIIPEIPRGAAAKNERNPTAYLTSSELDSDASNVSRHESMDERASRSGVYNGLFHQSEFSPLRSFISTFVLDHLKVHINIPDGRP